MPIFCEEVVLLSKGAWMMTDRIGQQLGNYRLVSLLGKGGFAEVYLGEHVHLDTKAAIKVLHTQLTGSDIERFRQEARLIAHLEHPHIVRVLDFGIEEDTPFLVMNYAPNGTLRQQHPKGTRLLSATIVSYIKQLAPALQYAHYRKLIHRDIKPENMLLDKLNRVVLSDFGIALVAQSSRYQSTQEMAGTMGYMAPEQIQGKPRPASDQYSLGIVVYEWLSGDRPFQGSVSEIVGQHLTIPPPSLLEKIPTISPLIEQIVFRALEKDPHKRFASVQEFVQALIIAMEQNSQKTSVPGFDSKTSATKTASASTAYPISQRTRELWLNEGDAHYNAKRYWEAIAAYNCAIGMDSNYSVAYNNRGKSYGNLKEFQKAIADFNNAIALDSKYAVPYYNRGNTHRALKQYQEAIADYNQAIAIDPMYARAYTVRGEVFFELKEYKKAIADFDQTITLDFKNIQVSRYRGNAYQALNDYEKAIADYDRAIELGLKDATIYYNRGLVYSKLLMYQQAINDYDRAIAINLNYGIAYNNRAIIYSNLKKYRQAIADFDYAIALNPNDARSYYNRGEAYRKSKNYQSAITDYNQAITLAPKFALAYGGRGEANLRLKQYQSSLQDFDQALQLDPQYTWASTRREEVYRFLKGTTWKHRLGLG